MNKVYNFMRGKGIICGSYRRFSSYWWKALVKPFSWTIILKFKDGVRRAIYGIAKCDSWGFDSYIAQVIVNGLSDLRSRDFGYPLLVEYTENEKDYNMIWISILSAIIDGFELYIKNIHALKDELDEDWEEQFELAFELFKEHFSSFWD